MDKNDPIVVALIQRSQAIQAAEENFLAALNDLLNADEADEAPTPAKKAPAKKTPPTKAAVSKSKAAPEPEPDEEEDADSERRTELEAMRITQLRALAKKRGFKEHEVAAADKATLVEAILDDEKNDAAEEPDEDEAESAEDADEEVQFDREDLQGKTLRELRALAKAAGHDASDYSSADKDTIIDLLLGEDDDADVEEDADEAAEGDEDDEGETWTEEEIRAMSLPELRKMAKECEIEAERGWKAKDYADALVALLNEDDEE